LTSKVGICNLALSNIGKPDIQDINEASAEALACKRFYDQTLAVLLEKYPWRWAQHTAALAEVTNTKSNRWLKAFRRPSDCRKLLYVCDELMLDADDRHASPYAIEGATIYCDIETAYAVYIKDQTDPTKFPALFVEALSWHLAVRLAMPLTRDPKMRADAYQLAERTTAMAEAMDANEQRENTDTFVEAIEVRK
jgi:hypothetical protein